MTNLLDIAPSQRMVETSFGKVHVPGLSVNALVSIIKQHPQLIDVIKGEKQEFEFNKILDLGLDVATSFLSSGLGYPGNEEAEKRCKELKPEDALDLGKAIMEESFPKGVKSFFEKVSKLIGPALDTNSLKPLQNAVKT